MTTFLKKLFIALGAAIALSVAAMVAAHYWLAKPQDAESMEAAGRVMREVCGRWDVAAARGLMDPDMLAATPEPQMAESFERLNKALGLAVAVGPLKGKAQGAFRVAEVSLVLTAEYSADVSFQKGRARVTVRLRKRQGAWRLLGLNLESAQ